MIPSKTFSIEDAAKAVEFLESLKLTKGQWHGVPWKLADWQRSFIEELYGRKRPDGRRQYRKAFMAIPKKNSKTAIASGIGLKGLCADNEMGAEVYSAAASRDQATLVYREMRDMARQTPRIWKRMRHYDSVKRLVYTTASGAENFYQALSADADYSDGINPSTVLVDELHRHKNRDLYDLLNEGSGTRAQPLTVVITTAGTDKTSVCYEEWEYARKVAAGIVDDPEYLAVIYEMPLDADWTDEREWFKCNPALGDFLDIEDLRKSVREAKEKPAKQNSVRRLRFNQWTSAESRWFDLGAWDACGSDTITAIEERNRGRRCFIGMDLASTGDLAAYVLVFPRDDEGYDILCRAYLPQAALEKRSKHAPVFAGWAREGFLKTTPGNVIDYDFIKADILTDCATYEVEEIGYDPWSAVQIAVQLEGEGLTCVPVRQGFATLSPPAKLLETLVARRTLHHGGHAVLRWCADNVQIEEDAGGNIKPSKKVSTEKIDVIAAAVTGLERAMHAEAMPSYSFISFE